MHPLDRHGHIMSLLVVHPELKQPLLFSHCCTAYNVHSARQHQLFTRCTQGPSASLPCLARCDNPTTIKLIKPSMTLPSSMVGDKPSLKNAHKGACCTQDCIAYYLDSPPMGSNHMMCDEPTSRLEIHAGLVQPYMMPLAAT